MYWNTVSPFLREVLDALMVEQLFNQFSLVGGTSLSLRLGHRKSVDIDLFTEAEYGSIDFDLIDTYLRKRYDYVYTNHAGPVGLGLSYFIGTSEKIAVKVDLFYTEPFIRPEIVEADIRLASKEDIIAMKLDVIARVSRKKDFWDLHALYDEYDIPEMIGFYKERYPYGFSEGEIRSGLINFSAADEDPDPDCLLYKHWELIKLDFVLG